MTLLMLDIARHRSVKVDRVGESVSAAKRAGFGRVGPKGP